MDQQGDTILTRTVEAAIVDVALRHGGVFRSDRDGAHMAELRSLGHAVAPDWILDNLALMVAQGRAIRIERGAYAIADAFGRIEPFAIGGHMVDLGYVSLWSAADHYNLTTQDVSTVSVITDRIKRPADIGATGFAVLFHKTTTERLFGYEDIQIGSTTARFATIEKMLIDLIWFFGAPATPDAFQTLSIWRAAFEERRANGYIVAELAVKMNSQRLVRRVGYLLEQFGQPGTEALRNWRRGERRAIPLLAGTPPTGAFSSAWGVHG